MFVRGQWAREHFENIEWSICRHLVACISTDTRLPLRATCCKMRNTWRRLLWDLSSEKCGAPSWESNSACSFAKPMLKPLGRRITLLFAAQMPPLSYLHSVLELTHWKTPNPVVSSGWLNVNEFACFRDIFIFSVIRRDILQRAYTEIHFYSRSDVKSIL